MDDYELAGDIMQLKADVRLLLASRKGDCVRWQVVGARITAVDKESDRQVEGLKERVALLESQSEGQGIKIQQLAARVEEIERDAALQIEALAQGQQELREQLESHTHLGTDEPNWGPGLIGMCYNNMPDVFDIGGGPEPSVQ